MTNDLDRDVDAEQMPHSNDPDCCAGKHYEPLPDALEPAAELVARVRPALVASHDVDVLGEHINDLPLPFIPPLTPDDDGARTLRWHLSPARRWRWSTGTQARKNGPSRVGDSPLTDVSFGKS